MKFKVVTLGCKVNTYESVFMKEKLIEAGYLEGEPADIIIINTCSVTNMADNKSKKVIRHEKRNNPEAIIVVCGCSAENNREKLSDLGINILIGNKDKNKIVALIKEYLDNKKDIVRFYDMRKLEFEDMFIHKFEEQTRSYIKIQDGCCNYCSYCIIPYLRGNIRSKDKELVLKEATDLVNSGHKELVLTGIDTGSYGKDKGYNLTSLLKDLSLIKGLERLRLSSVEITQLTSEFLDLLKDDKVLCNHLHIPLQAGSDKILKLMNRKYDLKYFFAKIEEIRSIRPDISITTDVIVGFPGETDTDFLTTLDTCQKLKFSKIHVFPYSKRDGTKASTFPNQVDNRVKKERARSLIELSKKQELEYNKLFLNKVVRVLIEEVTDNCSVGHTSNYLKVSIPKKLQRNEIYNVVINDVKSDICYGLLEGDNLDK